MPSYVVVDRPSQWDLDLPGATVIAARDYLTDPKYSSLRSCRVFNLCRAYGYQTTGYYVSLLAAARGHRPLPSTGTIRDIKHGAVVRAAADDLDGLVQKSLKALQSLKFTLSVYFGRNLAARYDKLSQALFNAFPAPLLRAEFARTDESSPWRIVKVRAIAGSDVPASHRDFIAERAARYFARPSRPRKVEYRYDLGILWNPDELDSPSDAKAIERFVAAARRAGVSTTLLTREDIGRVPEFDALLIRETTAVDHHTYRFSSLAQAEGLVVIDDPESIIRCTNKVYQAEVFARLRIPSPRTLVVHRDNAADVARHVGFPVVLKRPDSSFSRGVVKAGDARELERLLGELFAESDLLVAQEFTPSDFDWRIGVLGGEALYAARYFMARGHWQIQRNEGTSRRYGRVETLAVEDAPAAVVELAIAAANAMGDGFYGVDIKEVDGRLLVMEVNDNPSIEAGCEDAVLRTELYDRIIAHICGRLDARRTTRARP